MESAKIDPEPVKAINQTNGAKPVVSKSSRLLTARVFECYSPPPLNSVRGALLPRALEKHRRRRKISIEVHLVPIQDDDEAKTKDDAETVYEECIVRVLDPANDEERAAAFKRARLKGKNDDQSVADDATNANLVDFESYNFASAGFDKGWRTKYRFPVRALSIKGTRKTSVTIEITMDKVKEVRELIFDSLEESENFQALVRRELDLEAKRSEKKIAAVLGDTKIDNNEKMVFLVEIVSGWNLPISDLTASDPFVVCLMDGKIVHKTAHIPKTLNPVWTLTTGSLFLLEVEAKALFLSDGLKCIVYDYDALGADDKLGMIIVPPKQLYDARGERMEFKLQHPEGKKEITGQLVIRCRRATDYDKKFMANFNKPEVKGDLLGMLKLERLTETKGGHGAVVSILTRKTRIAKTGRNAGIKEYKVRPVPDPLKSEEFAWMSKKEIETACLEESRNWIETGSGSIARVYVEILGCDGLPNLDSGGFAGNKTDAFVNIVFEDAVVQTDIIDDSLAPRWLPWTKRAFIFNMLHSSSDLYIGVFDHDESLAPSDVHDLVGRVSVDVSNLRKNTMYVLTCPIYLTARIPERKQAGTITFRVRMEVDDERKFVLSTLEPPPQVYINLKSRKEFRAALETVVGKPDLNKYNRDVLFHYVYELLALKNALFYLKDAAIVLLFWQGTLEVKIGKHCYMFPIHSLVAFLATTLLVERPQLGPSFFFAGLAWALLASMDYRLRHPDVWNRCRSFRELVEILVLGTSTVPPDNISPNETAKEAEAFYEHWIERVKAEENAAAAAYEEALREQAEYEREMEEFGDGDTDISTKTGGLNIDPMKQFLFPLQQDLAMVVRYVRYLKYVATWQECYMSFWVTVGCCLLSLICFFVPWFFILKWTARILVWTVFGPWMKLVDVYYYSKIIAMSKEEQEKEKQRLREKRQLLTKAAVNQARIKRENANKLSAMKKYMFGKFIVSVPILKEDRYVDTPLPQSSAAPYKFAQRPLSELAMRDVGYQKVRIPGQHLVGDMIPVVASHGASAAPIGQATSQPGLVDKNGPGGTVLPRIDSTASAYIQIGSIIFIAGILTWFGVPLLTSITERALSFLWM